MKITTANKGTLQFAYSNPHLVAKEQGTHFCGILKTDIETVKAALIKAYGEDWFRFFLALKPATLNTKIGA